MQDGQNLFDPALSFAGTWSVDKALTWASRRGLDAIVVGIPNMGDARIAEYDPFMGTGDGYLDFVTHTVKPIVDAQFPTLPDRRHTGIAGSSMGGLISLYAFFRYSESFGFAAALSPSLWFADGALVDLVARAPRVPAGERLDPDVLSAPRARGELVRRAPAPGSASLAPLAVRSVPAGRSDPVQRRPEPEPIRYRGGCELRGLSRGVLRPAQSPPREPHHRPLRTVRHHPADRRVFRCQRVCVQPLRLHAPRARRRAAGGGPPPGPHLGGRPRPPGPRHQA